MQVKGKEDYIKTTEDFFQMVRGFELKRYVANRNLLATEVEIKVAAPSGYSNMSHFSEAFRKEFGID